MQTLTSVEAMQQWAAARLGAGCIGLVPTMGYLHEGHVSLMSLLRERCEHLVVSIYVNPLQFGAGEDLDRYPRDLEGDLARCEGAGVDAVFAPASLYPEGFSTQVHVSGLTEGLCGRSRPGHFAGVTTVVNRLFGLTRCGIAAFGEKDFQQLAVIRRMVRDLAMPVEVIGAPISREPDGLARSSRNVYLSATDRTRAVSLSSALERIKVSFDQGIRDCTKLREVGRSALDCDRLDYLEIVDAQSLEPQQTLADQPARALVACWLGSTRLIDNIALGAS